MMEMKHHFRTGMGNLNFKFWTSMGTGIGKFIKLKNPLKSTLNMVWAFFFTHTSRLVWAFLYAYTSLSHILRFYLFKGTFLDWYAHTSPLYQSTGITGMGAYIYRRTMTVAYTSLYTTY